MAELKIITNLDRKLIEERIIDSAYKEDYQIVHSMLNENMRQTGKILTEELFKKGEEALREWLITLFKQRASQEKLTSYLRCGLAHLCFDFIGSTYETIPTDQLIARAMQSFKLREYNKTFFKASDSLRKSTAKKPVKKTTKKTVKKAVKKTTAKKTSVKKAAVKKAAKKIPVKKTAVKKVAKKAAKKVVKKTEIKKKVTAKKKSAANKSTTKAVKTKAAVKKDVKKKTVKTEKKDTGNFLSRLFGKE